MIRITNGVKRLRSKDFNYDFDLATGVLDTWGATKEEDPDFCPVGPLIADVEITTKCGGVGGVPCAYCYKGNTAIGKNMSFDAFESVISKINYNQQLTQVAFGLGARGDENPELERMCAWLRTMNVVPNGTVAEPSDDAIDVISRNFGGCAVSYHGDFDVLCDSVKKLTESMKRGGSTLKQVNVHYVLCEETIGELFKLFKLTKEDSRLKDMNAIVLLALKNCGRAKLGNFHSLSREKFSWVVEFALVNKIGIGFDSCTANAFSEAVRKFHANLKLSIKGDESTRNAIEQALDEKTEELVGLAEPCEASLMSAYVDVDGRYHPCSFCPGAKDYAYEGLEILDVTSGNFENLWAGGVPEIEDFRKKLLAKGRSCPMYAIMEE